MYLQSGEAPNADGGAYSTPADPLAVGRGGNCPPQEPFPAVGLWPRILALRASGVPPKTWVP